MAERERVREVVGSEFCVQEQRKLQLQSFDLCLALSQQTSSCVFPSLNTDSEAKSSEEALVRSNDHKSFMYIAEIYHKREVENAIGVAFAFALGRE